MASSESNFTKEKILLLLNRYALSYYKEDICVEYFIADKNTGEQISYAVTFSLNTYSKRIHVGRFCPNLYKQIDSKYLSAACFYLLIHHFAHIYHLPDKYRLCLETRPATNNKFFSRLKDFGLSVKGSQMCQTVEVCGTYPELDIDTSMINKKIIEDKNALFQV